MIEPRIYRAAFLPALFAVVLVMFSLESRPRPLPQGLAADVLFDGDRAAEEARRIASEHPDRSPGSPGDRAVAGDVAAAFEGSGFSVERQRFEHDGRDLVNVIGRRAGRSPRQIVAIAARDAAAAPDAAASASDTAALVELARVLEGRPSERSLVLASVDGSTLGDVGVERLLDEIDAPDLVDGALVLSGLGAGGRGAPAIVAWGEGTRRASIRLQRTVAESLRAELIPPAADASSAGQLARLAFPLGIGGQGPLVAAGYDAVRIAGDGELGDAPPAAPVDADRVGSLGRATLRTVTALDQSARAQGAPRSYVTVAGQVMPGWVLVVLAGTLILPVGAAGVDALARARRRRAAVGRWLVWIATGTLPLLAGYVLALLLALVGVAPEPPSGPAPPGLYPLDAPAIATLALVAATVAGTWLTLRGFTGPSPRQLDEAAGSGAGVAVALALAAAGALLWLVDPFAALVAIPAVHLWALAVLVDARPSRRTAGALVAGGLALPALLAAYQLLALGLDPLAGAWYLLLLVVGGHLGPATVLVAALFASALVATVAIVARGGGSGGRGGDRPPPATRGPLTYAGPGSLGGTESALRR